MPRISEKQQIVKQIDQILLLLIIDDDPRNQKEIDELLDLKAHILSFRYDCPKIYPIKKSVRLTIYYRIWRWMSLIEGLAKENQNKMHDFVFAYLGHGLESNGGLYLPNGSIIIPKDFFEKLSETSQQKISELLL